MYSSDGNSTWFSRFPSPVPVGEGDEIGFGKRELSEFPEQLLIVFGRIPRIRKKGISASSDVIYKRLVRHRIAFHVKNMI